MTRRPVRPLPVLILLPLLGLAPALASPAAAQTLDLKSVVRQAEGAVVSLEAFDISGQPLGSGTGFFIQSGVVATNYHVVEDARSMKATLADGREVDVTGVLASSEPNDLALLRVPAQVAAPALELSGSGPGEPGDRIVVVGNPLGLSGTVSDGLIAAWRPDGLGPDSDFFPETPLLQVTAPISPGSSGSPVLDSRGKVIGVAVGTLLYGQNVNFAIPASSLIELLAGTDLGTLERSFSSPLDVSRWPLIRNLLLSALFFAALLVGIRLMKD